MKGGNPAKGACSRLCILPTAYQGTNRSLSDLSTVAKADKPPVRDTESVRSAHRGFPASAGLWPLRRTHGGCGGHPPRAEGQGEDQPRRVAGEAGRPPSPLAAPGGEAKSGKRPRRPQGSPRGPDSPSGPSPAAGPGPWAGRTGGSRRHLPRGSPASVSPGRQGQRGARANPPTYTRGCYENPRDPSARGVPTSSSRPPPHTHTQVPAAPGSEPGRPERTHLGVRAPPRLPGCSPPGPRSAPSRARPLRPPRLWPPPAALLRAPVGGGASRDMGEAGGRRWESLGHGPEGRGSSPGGLLGSPL